jgi:hypothetical protein
MQVGDCFVILLCNNMYCNVSYELEYCVLDHINGNLSRFCVKVVKRELRNACPKSLDHRLRYKVQPFYHSCVTQARVRGI